MTSKTTPSFPRQSKALVRADGQPVSVVASGTSPAAPPPNLSKELDAHMVRKLALKEIEAIDSGGRPAGIDETALVANNGFWNFVTATTGKQDHGGLTVADVTTLLDRYQNQNQPAPQNQGSETLGLMKIILENQSRNQPSISDLNAVLSTGMETGMALAVGNQPPPQNQDALLVDVLEKVGVFDAIKNRQQAPPPSTGLSFDLGGGKSLSLAELLTVQDRTFDREQKRLEFDEKRENTRAAREMAPQALNIFQVAAEGLRDMVAERRGTPQPSKGEPPAERRIPMETINCPNCGTPHSIPPTVNSFTCSNCHKEYDLSVAPPTGE